ncbi:MULTISPECIES: class I SAM-dependent methyltransferase [unclassified Roseovarius]|uniref:class I SAM-dependent methyltransferase n=1 Tax=unclassified Roseovarius TaxID=2614913 RepID=UPI00273D239E|nr:class I SAM-dependent methyltransferase [Roseovarius sp. MMSF_3350]
MNQISDTQFQADWLSLREAADHAARDATLLARAADCVRPGMRVLDLGSGTGSTARAFAAAGYDRLEWCFLDTDAEHLQVAKARHPMADCVQASAWDVEGLPLEHVGLVTASALLDLMSIGWADALADRLGDAGLPFYAALSFDGRMRWDPPGAADADVVAAFNRHQQGDKGGQAAMGPEAAKLTAKAFEARGFAVALADSAWRLGPDNAALQAEFVNGVGKAAAEAGEARADRWAETRRGAAGHTALSVGHSDLLALPPQHRAGQDDRSKAWK